MMFTFLITSVAMATTMLSKEVENASPVAKVITLLKDMQKELQAEAKEEQDMYEKLSCWCETNDKEKNAAVEQATAAIESLEEEIKRRTAKKAQLEEDIAAAEAEAEQLQQSLDQAEAARKKEADENHKAEVDYVTNIEALRGAITVLEKHQAKAFPQLHLDFIEESHHGINDDLDGFSKWMDQHHFTTMDAKQSRAVDAETSAFLRKASSSSFSGYTGEEVALLAKGKKALKSLLQSKHEATPYHSRSGEIFGIMTQLLEELTTDLDSLRKKEAQSVADFASLTTQLKEQLASAIETKKRKSKSHADNSKALVDAKENLEDTQASLDADTKFLMNLKETCTKSESEWAERSATRKSEIAAVSEALTILSEDDTTDTFTRTYSLVQLKAVNSARTKAAAVIAKAGKENPAMLALSNRVKLDAFTKVKKAINQMIETLKTEQGEEVKHKDFCNEAFHENDMETTEKTNQQEATEALAESLKSTIATLEKELKEAENEISELLSEQARANEDRVEQNKVFQQTIADQRATQVILKKALDRLAKFYNFVQTKAVAKTTAAVVTKTVAGQTPPVEFKEYKAHSGSGSVMTMIGELIGDAKKLEAEAIADENEAQAAYEGFVSNTNAARTALEKAIVDKNEMKANAEKDKVEAEQTILTLVEELGDLAEYKGNLHKSCDFVLKNFDTRQEARSQEMESLKQAIAILSGSM